MTRLIAALGLAGLLATSASAAVDFEDWQQYEEAYLADCMRDHSARACSCSMVALEERAGFEAFAEDVDRHRGVFFQQASLATTANDLISACTAVGSLAR